MRAMALTEHNIERRKRYVELGPEDVRRIAGIQGVVSRSADPFVASFFDALTGLEEARPLMADRELLGQARALKREHVLAMVGGDYGAAYVEQRLQLGLLFGRVGLDTKVFLGAFHHMLRQIGAAIVKDGERRPVDAFDAFMSLKKVAFFDIGIIIDTLVHERERTIRQQSEAIRELSTPVLQVRDRMLLLPIIGVIDTHRAQQITESLLHAIRGNRARVVVMDVTGVATVDSKVANHLMQTVTAAKLMGAQVIVTGLSADVAQSLVALGIELSRFNTVGDLQGGLEDAERMLGYRLIHPTAAAALAD
jgi:rsbT co-antagonist protein RsbR